MGGGVCRVIAPISGTVLSGQPKHLSEATSAVAFLTIHWSVWSALQPELHLLAAGSSSKEPASATFTRGETTMFTLSGVRSGVLWCKAALSVVN